MRDLRCRIGSRGSLDIERGGRERAGGAGSGMGFPLGTWNILRDNAAAFQSDGTTHHHVLQKEYADAEAARLPPDHLRAAARAAELRDFRIGMMNVFILHTFRVADAERER